MKRNLLPLAILLGITLSATLGGCSKKGIENAVTLSNAPGSWDIHAIRYNIYYGTPESKDSTIPWRGQPKNYVNFDGSSGIQYCYNSPIAYSGEYEFIGGDSIKINLNGSSCKWKIMLLTPTNFNIERTLTDRSAFPGSTKVVMFQGFVR